MKGKQTNSVVDDMWINTQADIDDIDSTPDSGTHNRSHPHRTTEWEQIQQENIILNPDPDSMESRG